MESNTRLCQFCGHALKGRIDKRFCDDNCRNNYNNNQNSEQNIFVRQINQILKKNRKILSELLPSNEDYIKIKQNKLSEKGFNFNYHTHLYTTQKQQTYHFCYEFGFLLLDKDWLLIVKQKEQH